MIYVDIFIEIVQEDARRSKQTELKNKTIYNF